MARVTQESDPELWDVLHKQWIAEKQPGWVARSGGMQSWKVVQLVNGSIAFDQNEVEGYYESTSFDSGG